MKKLYYLEAWNSEEVPIKCNFCILYCSDATVVKRGFTLVFNSYFIFIVFAQYIDCGFSFQQSTF